MFFHPTFVLFLLALFAIYWTAPLKFQRYIIILGSLCLYASTTSILSLSALFFIFIITYLSQSQKNIFKITGTFFILIPLFICKYIPDIINFWPSIIGISFFTFTAIARIWSNDNRYQFINTAHSLFFFPTIFSGPILNKGNLSDAMTVPIFEKSLWRITLGIFMKLVLAGWAGKASSGALIQIESMGILQWHGLLLTYGAQIYWDFAGYTHMAIGFAGLFGYKLVENFNAPYLSKNLQQFWQKWHISLALWLKTYIYIPLGGNKKGRAVQSFAIMTVMLICGLWHGNTWAFFIWGLWHGLGLVGLSLTQKRWNVSERFPWLAVSTTIYFVLWGWVPFFINDWALLFQANPWIKNDLSVYGLNCLLIGLGFISVCLVIMKNEVKIVEKATNLHISLQGLIFLLSWTSILWLSPWGIPDFIYFKF